MANKYVTYSTPMFESTAKIKLAERTEGVPNNDLFKNFDVFVSSNNIMAEIELMKSDVLVSRVIHRMGLRLVVYRVGELKKKELYKADVPFLIEPIDLESYVNQPFKMTVLNDKTFTISVGGLASTFNGKFGDTLALPEGQLQIKLNPSWVKSRAFHLQDDYEFTYHSLERVLQQAQSLLTVYPAEKDVPVVCISYKSTRAELASDFANALADAYIEDYINTRYEAARSTVDFLDDRITKVTQELSASERAIERYKDRRGVVNLRQESETDLRKIAQMKVQLTNTKIKMEAIDQLESKLRYNRQNFLMMAPNFEAHTDLLSTELVKKIKTLQAEKRDLLITYTPNDDRVKVVDEKIKDITDYLLEAVSNTRRDLSTKYYELQNEIAIAEQAFVGFSTKEKDLTTLKRNFTIYQNSFTFLYEKRLEAEIAKAAKISLHRIISRANPERKPISPNRPVILAVATILGLVLGIGLVMGLKMLRGTISQVEYIETHSDIPVLLRTPYLPNKGGVRSHFLKEAIQLEIKGMVGHGERIVLSSFGVNEGCSFHVKAMAQAFSDQGKKVIVLDSGVRYSHPNCDTISLKSERFVNLDQVGFRQAIETITKGYDLVLINNEGNTDSHLGLLVMSIADHNLFMLDTQISRTSVLDRVDQLKDAYGFHNIQFVLNHHNYSLGYGKHVVRWFKQLQRTKMSNQQ